MLLRLASFTGIYIFLQMISIWLYLIFSSNPFFLFDFLPEREEEVETSSLWMSSTTHIKFQCHEGRKYQPKMCEFFLHRQHDADEKIEMNFFFSVCLQSQFYSSFLAAFLIFSFACSFCFIHSCLNVKLGVSISDARCSNVTEY